MSPRVDASWALGTAPPGRGVAICEVGLRGDIDAALDALAIRPVAPGRIGLRVLAGVDEGLVARWSTDAASLMPHGGPAVVTRVVEACVRAGLRPGDTGDAGCWPEARDPMEARMLAALARAASPLAIDLLLDQARRWAHPAGDDPGLDGRSARLARLIDPPLVAALGAPNIGKSSLLNAIAGRSVAVVADAPGTTRDHVGARVAFAGVVVRYIDTPGIDPGSAGRGQAADGEAQRLALGACARADLVLLCADRATRYLAPPGGCGDTLRVGLRADLGAPAEGADVLVSAFAATGLDLLAEAIAERLVPRADREHPGRWRFWTND